MKRLGRRASMVSVSGPQCRILRLASKKEGVLGLGFGGLGFRLLSPGFRVEGLGFKV